MKFMKMFAVALMLPFITMAQAVDIKEGKVKMGKTPLWSFTATYDYPKTAATEAMDDAVNSANIKRTSRKKGFSIYKGVAWQAISNTKADYYYKIKSKKNKTTVYFVASKGYDNYITSANDAEIAANIKGFLQNLNSRIATNLQVKSKEAELQQAQAQNATLTKQATDAKAVENKKTQELKTLQKQQQTY